MCPDHHCGMAVFSEPVPSPNGGKSSNMERNKIDDCTTNGCPDVTPAQLLAEQSTPEDLNALEQVMGRFESTTGFLGALKQVLFMLESFAEVDALAGFIPMMAQVESSSMNEETPVRLEVTVSETERILRILRDDSDINPPQKSIQDYPRVENGVLLNSGELSYEDRFNIATQLIDG